MPEVAFKHFISASSILRNDANSECLTLALPHVDSAVPRSTAGGVYWVGTAFRLCGELPAQSGKANHSARKLE